MASRSRSRSPQKRSHSFNRSERGSPTPSNSSETNKSFKRIRVNPGRYHLQLSSVPLNWKYQHVSSYISKHTSADKAIAEDITYIQTGQKRIDYLDTQEVIVMFKSEHCRQQAFEMLKATHEKVNGKKIFVRILVKNFPPKNAQVQPPPPYRYGSKYLFDYNCEENETYGLSNQYLGGIGITNRPLVRWVFVKGLPVEFNNETKVREVFGKAGSIVSAAVIESKVSKSYNARIEYDHPVEAVQAVSMFNKREIRGSIMSCEMDFLKKNGFINGVAQGPGLGPDGTPMRGIRVSMECKKIKNEFMEEIRKMNDSLNELKAQVTNLFMEVENQKSEVKTVVAAQNPLNQNVSNPLQNTANPLAALGTILTNQLQPLLLQGLMQQNSGNDTSAIGSLLQNVTAGNMNLNSLLQQVQSNIQNSGTNMQAGSNFLSGSKNMQSGPNNMQAGPNNLHGDQNNMHSDTTNLQGGQGNMQGGPNNIQMPTNMFSSFGNMQSNPNMQSVSQNQGRDAGFNTPNQSNRFGNRSTDSPTGQNNQMDSCSNNYFVKKIKNCSTCGDEHLTHHCRKNKRPNPNAKRCFKCSKTGHLAHECRNNYGNNSNERNQMSNQNDNQQQSGSSVLLFQNLPSAVSQQVLKGKMQEVGEVKLVEMTGPGRAVVSFCYDNDADKCIRLFNESKVDGQIVLVRRLH